MGWDIAALLAGLLGAVATVATYFIKKKQDKKEDQDALAIVEKEEVEAGMDRVDALDAASMRDEQERKD